MKAKPILFSSPMVSAILAERKNKTRRIMRPQPIITNFELNLWAGGPPKNQDKVNEALKKPYNSRCKPKYQVGDIIYVREAFYAYGEWSKEWVDKKKRYGWVFKDYTLKQGFSYAYENNFDENKLSRGRGTGIGWYKRPSLFMPKEAARIFKKIKSIAIERACDITEEEAIAEGIVGVSKDGTLYKYCFDPNDSKQSWSDMPKTAVSAFERLWGQINGMETWNNWVYVYAFENVDKNNSANGSNEPS